MTSAYVIFHHNLLYSSIPEAHIKYVVDEIYSRLLEFSCEIKLSLEFNGWSLEKIAELSPKYIETLGSLVRERKVEIIASSYTQAVFPLIPYKVNKKNIELGLKAFEEILGVKPKIFLLNEMAYSKGTVKAISEFGFEAFIFDWVNAVKGNPWGKKVNLWAVVENEGMKILWADTYMTQKFQRFVWGEIDEDDYKNFVKSRLRKNPFSIPVYVGDAEVFEYIPGSLVYSKGGSDIKRMKKAFDLLKNLNLSFCLPSEVLERAKNPQKVEISSPDYPIRVKKQDKYNITRWAVTGRDSSRMNAQCYRLVEAIEKKDSEKLWKNLCILWASDFRTSTTDDKYLFFRNLMGKTLGEISEREVQRKAISIGECRSAEISEHGRYVTVETPYHKAVFIKNKGLALKELVFKGVSEHPLVGTVEHGFYDDISYGADFYSFHLIFATKDGRQLTDLSCIAEVEAIWENGILKLRNKKSMDLPFLSIIKEFWFGQDFVVLYRFYFKDLYPMSVRLGIVTAIPEAFDRKSLFFSTHNGGKEAETFPLAGRKVLLDAPVNYIVTARGCLGATEGMLEFGDSEKKVIIKTDKSLMYTVPLLRYEEIEETFFLRIYHSTCERDDVAHVFFKGYSEALFILEASRIQR